MATDSLFPPSTDRAERLDAAVSAWDALATDMVEVVVLMRSTRRTVVIAMIATMTMAAVSLVGTAVMVSRVQTQVQALIETQAKREAADAARRALRQRVGSVQVVEALEQSAARSALEGVQGLPNPPEPALVEQLKQAVESPRPTAVPAAPQ